MAKHWRDVKAEIEQEIDKVWIDEPLELTLSKKGIFPGGAGTNGQAAGNIIFQFADSHAIGGLVFRAPMFGILDREDFTLDQCKHMFYSLNMNKCRILGGNHGLDSKCPAAWLNLPKFQAFFVDIVDAYDTIETKEDFRSLLWSWFNYVDRINKWTYTLIPWSDFGDNLPVRGMADLTEEEYAQCKECGIIIE